MPNKPAAAQQTLRDAVAAKCGQTESPMQTLATLAQATGVGVKTIAKASSGHPICAVDHLRLCAALGIDPTGGRLRRYPAPSTFDFGLFSMAFRIRQGLNGHQDAAACRVVGIKPGTLKRLKLGHALPIGPVLRACAYIGVHPFGYFATAAPANVSRETSSREAWPS